MAKYPYSTHTSKERSYNYTKIMKARRHFPTEKQLKYIEDLKATCERVGIDLTNFEIRTNDMNAASGSIKALLTILEKNGYDSRGNAMKVYNMYDTEQ